MAVQIRHSGFGTTGPYLLIEEFGSTDTPIFVDSVTGSDANAGTESRAPKATVFGAAGAISVCTTGQSNVVVCASTHREAVAAYTWSTAGVTLVSFGSGTARATFTCSDIIDVTGADVRIENCYFPASSAGIARKINVGAVGFEMRDCQLEGGANDATALVRVNAVGGATFKGTTFKVTASVAGTTRRGLLVTGAATDLLVEECTFDGGSYGWTSGYALEIDTATADRFRLRRLTLQNYSFAGASISGVKGFFSGSNIDATSGWKWAE